MEDAQHVTTLNHLIADQIEHYLDQHPGLSATVVLTAVGEAFVNLGVQQMGQDYTLNLCQQLQEAIKQSRQ